MKKHYILLISMFVSLVSFAQTKQRVVDIEHHFGNRTMFDAYFLETQGFTLDELPEDQRAIYYTTLDLGAGRIAAMDAAGVDFAQLSLTTPGAEAWGPAMGKQIAREANDSIAKAIAAYPNRIGGWMTLYPDDVEWSLQEIERCKEMGLYGWACLSNMQGMRLDDPRYWPIFKKLEELGMPVYLHPEFSNDEAIAEFGYCINGPALGFQADALTTFMRMMCRGLFDECPDLKIILGHDGEGLPFFKNRINAAVRRGLDKAWSVICEYEHEPSYYIDHNVWVTTSGNFSTEALRCCLDEMPAGHVMMSTDYPYEDFAGAVSFVRDNLKLTDSERKAILADNAMALGFGTLPMLNYQNLTDTIAFAEDYSSTLTAPAYGTIKAALDEAIATAKSYLTATSQDDVDAAAHALQLAMADAISAVGACNYDNGIFTGVTVSVAGSTSTLFFQTADRPSVSIRRDGNSRIAQVRLAGSSEVRRQSELTPDSYLEFTFGQTVLGSRQFSFFDQVSKGYSVTTTSREEVDAVHGPDFAIHYERNFTHTGFDAWNVPFNLKQADAQAAGLTLYRLNMSYNNLEDGVGSELITFGITQLKDSDVATANKPYLVKPNQTGVVSFDLTSTELQQPKSATVSCSTTRVTYSFISNCQTLQPWELSGCYVMKHGMLEFVIADPCSLSPWRWYMEPSVKDYVYYAPIRFEIIDEGEDDTTSLPTITTLGSEGIYYNLNGQRISNPVKGQIYIVNGKKVKL